MQREELLIVLSGRLSLRTADGWEDLPEGQVVAFPRGERGAHGYQNRGDRPVQALVVSEMNGPNISACPDTNQVGILEDELSGASARCSTSVTPSLTTEVGRRKLFRRHRCQVESVRTKARCRG